MESAIRNMKRGCDLEIERQQQKFESELLTMKTKYNYDKALREKCARDKDMFINKYHNERALREECARERDLWKHKYENEKVEVFVIYFLFIKMILNIMMNKNVQQRSINMDTAERTNDLAVQVNLDSAASTYQKIVSCRKNNIEFFEKYCENFQKLFNVNAAGGQITMNSDNFYAWKLEFQVWYDGEARVIIEVMGCRNDNNDFVCPTCFEEDEDEFSVDCESDCEDKQWHKHIESAITAYQKITTTLKSL